MRDPVGSHGAGEPRADFRVGRSRPVELAVEGVEAHGRGIQLCGDEVLAALATDRDGEAAEDASVAEVGAIDRRSGGGLRR